MEFTLEQRREIYRKAYEVHLKDIEYAKKYNTLLNGMCQNMFCAYYDLKIDYTGVKDMINSLPEFKALMPKNKDTNNFWWPLYNYEIRKQMYEQHLINI